MMNIPNHSPILRSSPTPPVAPTTSRESLRLADDFAPSENDIVCGRSKQSLNHVGNQRFRETIFANLDRYNAAVTKLDKSLVVTSIVEFLRSKSPDGGFVRKDDNGHWYEIGDQLAREKVGHALRDAIKTRNKRAQRKRALKKSAMDLKREALLKAQRLLFTESLAAAGEEVDPSLLLTEETSSEQDEQESSSSLEPNESGSNTKNNSGKKRPSVTAAFYDVDDVEKEALEPPTVARQITLDDVSKDYDELVTPMSSNSKKKALTLKSKKRRRKAMGDGEYYDIAPTCNRRQVTLDNNSDTLATNQPCPEPMIQPTKLMTLDEMPEPTPVAGPGIVANDASHKTTPETTTTPLTCNRRRVSVEVPKKENDNGKRKSITFSLYDVELDTLDNYVVQRISTSSK